MDSRQPSTEQFLQELAALRRKVAELESDRSAVCTESDHARSIDALPHFAAIVNGSQDAIIATNIDGMVTSWNPGAEWLYGYTAAEVLGKHVSILIPDGHQHELLPIIEEVVHGKCVGPLEVVCRRKDGSLVEVSITISPTKDAHGRVIGGSCIGQDITARRQAENTLRQSEERYRNLVENINLGISMMDRQHRVVAINRAQAGMFDKPVSHFLGHECFRMFEKREAVCAHCPGVRAMRTGVPAEVETIGVRDDGTTFAVRVQAFPVRGSDGSLEGFIELVEDISQRKQAERDLIAARQAAEAANRAKSEFLANMSHEIRTPMTAILGFADILRETVTSLGALDAANTIKRNGEYLLELINSILDLSKIEAGRLVIERAVCFPLNVAADVLSLMRVPADAKRLDLRLECRGSIPETIHSSPTRLRQILINLVGNAIKFTEVGSVRLVLRLLDNQDGSPKLQFDVIDSGIGMTDEQVARLFQPFTQADTSTSRKFGGTGLGLTISKRLAQSLGGDILVHTAPAAGSTFSLTVDTGPLDGVAMVDRPGTLPKGPQPRRSCPDPAVSLPCRVLLAEDGPDNQRLISFFLKKFGADVAVAENGRVAVELASAARNEGRPFDLVLMDMQMPVMDGYEATRQLRAAGDRMPIIAITAHAMIDDRQKCLAAGCTDYLAKPIERLALQHVMSQYAAAWPVDLSALGAS